MKDFTQGNILKQMVAFTLPIIGGNLLQALYNVIDAVWVGRILGYQALAAVSAVTPLVFFLVSTVVGLCVSTNILIGRSFGAGSEAALMKVLSNSCLIIMSLGVIMSIAGVVFSKKVLGFVNTPASIKADAYSYIRIILAGMVFTVAYNWVSGVLRGLGDSYTPLKISAVSVIINIIITPLFILGIGPIPKLGVGGSALGTVLSVFAAVVIGYCYLVRRNHLFNIKRWDFRLDFDIVKKIFAIGIPASAHIILISLSGIMIMSLVNKFGPQVIAAYGIGLRMDMFAFLASFSIGIAVTSMAAQNLGAAKFERIPRMLKGGIVLALGFSMSFFIIVNLWPAMISSFFTRDESVIYYAVRYFRLVSITYIIFAFVFVLGGVLRGAGDTKWQLLFTVISMLVLRIPLAFLFTRYSSLRETGIWLALVVSAFAAGVLNSLYYRSGRWRSKVNFVRQ